MWRSYFTENKWLLWSWGGFAFIILSLLAQTYIDVKINEWYKGFYDLLQDAPNRELSCLLYTSPSPRDQRGSRMPSSA